MDTGGDETYIAVGDLDGANGSDLAVSNNGSSSVAVLLNQPGGTFTAASGSPITVGTLPQFVVVAPLNNDALPDIAVANSGSNSVSVLDRQAGGGFVAETGSPFTVGTGPWAWPPEAHGTGRLDLVTADQGDPTGMLTVLSNSGTTFTRTADFATPVNPTGIATGQFNDGDTLTDIAVTSIGSSPGTLSVFINQANSAPTNLTKPAISGTPLVGNQLSCTHGTWTQSPTTFTTLWDRGPRSAISDSDPGYVAINGATGSTYVVQQADAGLRVRCRVIAMNPKGNGTGAAPPSAPTAGLRPTSRHRASRGCPRRGTR